ncbi:MAG: rhomboid family intramembrane serine protease [Armatimonadota bacterium]
MLIPLRDQNPGRSFPIVTVALIVANVVAFFKELQLQASGNMLALQSLMMVPAEIATGRDLPPAPAPLNAPIITVFTSMFLHAGWLHLIGNMLFLWIFGDNVEDRLGHFRFLIFYLLCGVIAAMVHVASDPRSTVYTVGASGAISGVLGAYMVLFPWAMVQVLFTIYIVTRIVYLPAWVLLGMWFLFQVLESGASGTGGGVAYFAHIGGFAAGVILVWLFVKPRRRTFYRYYG